ncbi:Plasmid stabilization system protein [Aquisphaera giovannonii]|uniref:Plasmid stabilization system protein n=1 Tax=Aquisphaera giovannonii TaxID=406548 RepID=A0A5B9W4B0_9BACT|nr:type II toxin-antitoxin system RelE/ParE family toxin [Aquisphaera giovannonii]QEH35446.1 Plasmid stabilization system protein [Aquisphaera giovannonii]
MNVVRLLARARWDLVEAVAYLAERSEKAARRFRVEADETFQRLAAMPGMGARFKAEDPALAGLRYAPISARYRKYVAFYRPIPDGIEVIRVLHGARDIRTALAEEFDAGEEGGDELAP